MIEPQGRNGSRRRAPSASSIGTPRESQANFRVGPYWDCRRVLWEPSPRGQYSGKNLFIEKYVVQDEGVRHVAKYSSYPRQAYSEVKLQGLDLVRLVGVVAPFATMWAGTRGKFVLSTTRRGMGPGDTRRCL